MSFLELVLGVALGMLLRDAIRCVVMACEMVRRAAPTKGNILLRVLKQVYMVW